jgi:hypothetical protein
MKDVVYPTELVVNKGKKSVETDADITFSDSGLKVVPDKKDLSDATKEFAYSEIKTVDYSFAKKPMLSGGGAVATALLVSVFVAVPLLFVKKKRYWAVVRTETDYAVLKLGSDNHRQIIEEFRARGVSVSELKEEGK